MDSMDRYKKEVDSEDRDIRRRWLKLEDLGWNLHNFLT